MSIYAVINNDTHICENVIVLEEGSTWTPPDTHYIINIDALQVGIKWTYDIANNTWTAPPEPEPTPEDPAIS